MNDGFGKVVIVVVVVLVLRKVLWFMVFFSVVDIKYIWIDFELINVLYEFWWLGI